jgi:hypothetical protein
MPRAAWYVPALITAFAGALTAQAPDTLSQPLFASHDILRLTIAAPFKTIFRDRGQESEEHPGVLSYVDAEGASVDLDVQIRTRGKFRLQGSTCNFPNIRLNFKKQQVENSVFHNQDKLKLVAHCQSNRAEYEQQTLLEYLIYRSLNLFTDLSFRVRLAQITYVDTEEADGPLTKYAFFIEDEDLMAARNGWQAVEVPAIRPEDYEAAGLALVEVFQFMIGNTDWDAFRPEPDDPCCHNTKLVGSLQTLTVIPVPYDFDWSGLIDARYATPNPELRLRSVRDRLFRGICRPREELDAALAVFADRREAVYETFRSLPGLDPRRLEDTVEYLDEFYEILGDPNKVEREIVRRCRQA